jgi:hypothetical protein
MNLNDGWPGPEGWISKCVRDDGGTDFRRERVLWNGEEVSVLLHQTDSSEVGTIWQGSILAGAELEPLISIRFWQRAPAPFDRVGDVDQWLVSVRTPVALSYDRFIFGRGKTLQAAIDHLAEELQALQSWASFVLAGGVR